MLVTLEHADTASLLLKAQFGSFVTGYKLIVTFSSCNVAMHDWVGLGVRRHSKHSKFIFESTVRLLCYRLQVTSYFFSCNVPMHDWVGLRVRRRSKFISESAVRLLGYRVRGVSYPKLMPLEKRGIRYKQEKTKWLTRG